MTLTRPRPHSGDGRVRTPTSAFCFRDPKVLPPHSGRLLRCWLTQQQIEWLFLCSPFLHQRLVSQLIPGQPQINWVGSNRQTMLALRVQLPYVCPGLQQTSSRQTMLDLHKGPGLSFWLTAPALSSHWIPGFLVMASLVLAIGWAILSSFMNLSCPLSSPSSLVLVLPAPPSPAPVGMDGSHRPPAQPLESIGVCFNPFPRW